MFWVEAGENWYDRADAIAVGGADSCEELAHCPAPHAGFVTKGDHNANYDQASRLSAPVRPAWIVGTAELRVPYLGHVRLLFSTVTVGPLDADSVTASGSAAVSQAAIGATHSATGAPASAGADRRGVEPGTPTPAAG
jgi:signal peptidase